MYTMRFKEEAPERRSVQQLRGIEEVRVRKMYELIARQYNVTWRHRDYAYNEWESGDIPNRCLSSATACLYGIGEAKSMGMIPDREKSRGTFFLN